MQIVEFRQRHEHGRRACLPAGGSLTRRVLAPGGSFLLLSVSPRVRKTGTSPVQHRLTGQCNAPCAVSFEGDVPMNAASGSENPSPIPPSHFEDMTIPELSASDRERFDRNIRLAEIGEAGQRRLLGATASVIGAGGLGSAAILYLVAAGIGSPSHCRFGAPGTVEPEPPGHPPRLGFRAAEGRVGPRCGPRPEPFLPGRDRHGPHHLIRGRAAHGRRGCRARLHRQFPDAAHCGRRLLAPRACPW